MGAAGQDWSAFASAMLPGLLPPYQQDGVPCWLTLAMAAHESGIPTLASSTYVIEGNPWGLRPWAGSSQYSSYTGANGAFVVYPTLADAGANLVVALGLGTVAGRTAYTDPAAFMGQLQATGWDGAPPASDGYADSVIDTWGPPAQTALRALGLDIVTGQPSSGTPPPSSPVPVQLAVPLGVLGGIAAVVLAAEYGLFEAVSGWARRSLGGGGAG